MHNLYTCIRIPLGIFLIKKTIVFRKIYLGENKFGTLFFVKSSFGKTHDNQLMLTTINTCVSICVILCVSKPNQKKLRAFENNACRRIYRPYMMSTKKIQ